MNRLLTFLGFAVVLSGFYSCSCDCDKQNASGAILGSPQRAVSESGGKNASNAFFASMREKSKKVSQIQLQSLSLASLPKDIKLGNITLETTQTRNEDVDASAMVMNIFNSLLKAEGMENKLDLQFSMSDKPVEDGIFLFALQTPEDFKGTEKLVLQMFNEEGFEMVAHNQFQITPGNNYRALNVKDFAPGTYIFRLSDGGNREMLRRVQIGAELTQ